MELGGTKTMVAAGWDLADLSEPTAIPTTDPVSTLETVVAYLRSAQVDAVGVASFGPVELHRSHERWGHITRTPKEGWSGTSVAPLIEESLAVPVGFDTDVNGAALGEGEWGAAIGLANFAYITVGTGVGGGVIVEGSPVHGEPHPEVGHVIVRRHPGDDYEGACPFHGDCLEGLAAGPAMEGRFGKPARDLKGEGRKRAAGLAAFYLAQGVRDLVYVTAPERVVIGGGISKLPGLHTRVRSFLTHELGGYPGSETHAREEFVVPPGLGDLSGLAGAILLARELLR